MAEITCPVGYHPDYRLFGTFPFVGFRWECIKDRVDVPEKPDGPGKNPHGGGGNQWIEEGGLRGIPQNRQGLFGPQSTNVGKIVHKRKRHRWTTKDVTRVTKAWKTDIEAHPAYSTEEAWTIFDFVIETFQHIMGGVRIISAFPITVIEGLNFIESVLVWFKANKAWEEAWRPRFEAAIEKFWQEVS